MKRLLAILMATMMLTGVLTACSGTLGMNDRGAYGNVSTTPNGNVNGSNRSFGGSYGYQNGNGGNSNGYQNGNGGSTNGYQNGNGGNTNGYYGYGSGTGMTGGQ